MGTVSEGSVLVVEDIRRYSREMVSQAHSESQTRSAWLTSSVRGE